MTLRTLRERMVFWQEILNLREWTLTLRRFRKGDPKDCDGFALWSCERLEAEIVISNKCDQEATLVHELLHLVVDGHTTYETYSEPMERAINRITKALITLHSMQV